MVSRLDQALDDIEAAYAAIDAALGADDLEAVALGDRELNAGLTLLAALLDDHGERTAARALQTAAARMARVLERHGELAERLAAERDRTADELRGLRSGRRAATHYLDTAAAAAR